MEEKPGQPPRRCEQCGQRISKKLRTHAKFCSASCRSLAYYHRTEGGEIEKVER